MSDTDYANGGADSCCCPNCDEWFPCDIRVIKEGDSVQCTNCQSIFEIRYMNVDVIYYLRELERK